MFLTKTHHSFDDVLEMVFGEAPCSVEPGGCAVPAAGAPGPSPAQHGDGVQGGGTVGAGARARLERLGQPGAGVQGESCPGPRPLCAEGL